MIRNIFACLVHESPECVVDLVRNLRRLDPASTILLYDGGRAPGAIPDFPFERFGAIVHPRSKPMAWGRLHDFALECMRFALANIPFDTLTIVDSDQLAVQPGYSEMLGGVLVDYPRAGLFSNVPKVLPATSQMGPAPAAFQELDLWRPFLRRFADGERKFPHWSFWPSTVFTADAARDLTRLFDGDSDLQDIMRQTRIWATEEIILPTLTALLGYDIAAKPSSSDFVQYRAKYNPADVENALTRPDVYWMHPVARRYDDPARTQIRKFFSQYEPRERGVAIPELPGEFPLLLCYPILQRMRRIEGWFDDEEGDLLIAATARALSELAAGFAIVEAGCFCGRATVVLASVVERLKAKSIVYAIDAHDGRVGALDQGLKSFGPTLERFRKNISESGVRGVVETVQGLPSEVPWNQPIGLLLIDGLHDYPSVARDFHHFEKWVTPGGYVAFHDCADYYPGVQSFVSELAENGAYRRIGAARSLVVFRKEQTYAPAEIRTRPFVSCIMPTADRRLFIPQAINYFLRQDYPDRELIIVDDGADSVEDLMPDDESVRYIRLPGRISMGAKHNLACEHARGDVIVHLDDDDWNAPWRVSCQVNALARSPASAICGLSRILFYEPVAEKAWEYVYPMTDRPWVYGATFCYRRSFWEQHRFPDMNEGADTTYVWNLKPGEVLALEDHRFFVATVHAHNTSPKRTNTAGWQPRSSLDIRNVLDDEGRLFYEKMKSTGRIS